MPCSVYKGGQRRLCYATNEWKDWSKVKRGLAGASRATRRRVSSKGGRSRRR